MVVQPADEWSFDAGWLTVNHGSYGACPRSVRAAQAAWRERFERQPSAFMHRDLTGLLRDAASVLARFLGASADDTVFVENATSGCNAVLRSFPFAAGDEILLFDQAYGAVRNTVRFVAERAGATVIEVVLPFPDCPAEEAVRRVATAITGRTVMAVLDHVTSPGALVLPIAGMVAACRQRGVAVLVDGAHAPGQLPLELDALGADWYAGNLHKWLFAPVGSGFLHARGDRQEGLHPTAISHGLGQGFAAEFDWTGTRDVSGWLAVPDAIGLHERLGGRALMARNAALAREGAGIVAAALGTAVAPGCLPGGSMALARLPDGFGSGVADALALRARLVERRVDAPVVALAGGLWVRVSAQLYNEEADYGRLAAVVAELGGA
jgi:isopenicillin-N epimerase